MGVGACFRVRPAACRSNNSLLPEVTGKGRSESGWSLPVFYTLSSLQKPPGVARGLDCHL